jgi:hypothetical protein
MTELSQPARQSFALAADTNYADFHLEPPCLVVVLLRHSE